MSISKQTPAVQQITTFKDYKGGMHQCSQDALRVNLMIGISQSLESHFIGRVLTYTEIANWILSNAEELKEIL